jgi:hypothetical protein
MVSAADQQQLEKHALKPNHKSAYETDMFTKATARLEGESLPRLDARDSDAKAEV